MLVKHAGLARNTGAGLQSSTNKLRGSIENLKSIMATLPQ